MLSRFLMGSNFGSPWSSLSNWAWLMVALTLVLPGSVDVVFLAELVFFTGFAFAVMN